MCDVFGTRRLRSCEAARVADHHEIAPGVSIDLSGSPDLAAVASGLRRAAPGTALFFFDRHLRVILAGGPALTAAGYRPEQMEGRLLEDILPPDLFARLAPHYRAALSSGENASMLVERPQASFQVSLAPVRNETGSVIGLYALARTQ